MTDDDRRPDATTLPAPGRRRIEPGEWGYGYAAFVDLEWTNAAGNWTGDEAQAAGFMATYEDEDGHWVACKEGGIERVAE